MLDANLAIIQGTIYTVETDTHGDYLVALNAANGSVLSQHTLQDGYHTQMQKFGAYESMSYMERGLAIGAHSTYQDVYNWDRVEAFDNQTGVRLWQYTFSKAANPDIAGLSLTVMSE